jgi:hypothetical protein
MTFSKIVKENGENIFVLYSRMFIS